MPETLTLDFDVLTPLFLGDADQRNAALRPPSIKGLLRGWYRAISPTFAKPDSPFNEAGLFGSAGTGQSPFLLRVRETALMRGSWDKGLVARFDKGNGRNTKNGLRYLGYPFDLLQNSQNGRNALGPGTRFQVQAVFPRASTEPQRRALLAAAWLLGHLGGAGSRSRRGFGSLALRGWKLESPVAWDESNELPMLHESASASAWRSGLDRGLATLRGWFDSFPAGEQPPPHPHIGDPALVLLDPSSERDWASVLDRLGRTMQDFRLRRAPDYQEVKDHLSGQGRLERAPERAAFGLPLTFRYSSARGSVTFAPYDEDQKTTRERHGSLLHLRVAALADGLHPLYLRLNGSEPGQSGSPVAPRGAGRGLRAPRRNAVNDFIAEIETKIGRD